MNGKLKVLIADDEQLVCVLLQDMIDWEGIGLTPLGAVYDGNSAYQAICEQEPDIVLTDIRMPGKDGLELVRLCQKENRTCEFVAISGHKEFEYAHSAIQYGVNYFLVKPINAEELNGILRDIRGKYDEKRGQIERQKQIQLELEKSRQKIQDDFLNLFRTDPKQVCTAPVSELNQKYMLRLLPEGSYLFFIVRLDGKLMNTDEYMDTLLCQAAEKIKKRLKGSGWECIVQQEAGTLFCMVNGMDMDAAVKEIEAALPELIQDLYMYAHVTAGLSRVHSSLEGEMADEAELAAVQRLDDGVDRVIRFRRQMRHPMPLSNEQMLEFLNLVGLAKTHAVEEYFDAMRDGLLSKPATALYLAMKALLSRFYAGMGSLYGTEEIPWRKEVLFRMLRNGKTKQELYDMTRKTVISCLTEYNEATRTEEHWCIREAKRYVQEHYSESISLDDVAGCLHISPAYFSTLFKRQEGIGFIDYLLGFRIDIAKKMLCDRQCNITELAEKIGYRDQKYFSKLFKKTVGITPTEYKKLHGR